MCDLDYEALQHGTVGEERDVEVSGFILTITPTSQNTNAAGRPFSSAPEDLEFAIIAESDTYALRKEENIANKSATSQRDAWQ